MLATYKEIRSRVGQLESDRENYDWQRQQIADHVLGERDFQVDRSVGEKRTRLIYDSTGMFSWKILSAALYNFLVNVETEFFDLITEDPRLMEMGEVREWIEETQDTLKKLVSRPESGFSSAMQEGFDDLVGFGMMAIVVRDVPGLPIGYSVRPISEIYVTEDANGGIDSVWRKFRLTHRQAVGSFGAAKLPKIAGQLDKDADGKTCFWHGVHKTSDPLASNVRMRAPWRSVFISDEEEEIVRESGMRRNPYKVARWDKHAGEVYGRGPGHTALPEQRMTNAMAKTIIESAQLKARPPVAVSDDDVINPLNLNPEGQNVVRATAFTTDPIRLLETTGDIGLSVEMYEQRRAAVRGAFLHDLLEILQGPINTATQVIEMVQKARSLLAPTISRLQAEAIEPIINDSFDIAFRAGAFTPPPDVLRGQRLKVVYHNPVARSQQESDGRAIDDLLGFAGNVAQFRPDILDNLDFDAALRERHRAAGVVARVLRTQDEVKVIREQREQQLARERQNAEAAQAAEAAGKAAPALQLLQGGAQAA